MALVEAREDQELGRNRIAIGISGATGKCVGYFLAVIGRASEHGFGPGIGVLGQVLHEDVMRALLIEPCGDALNHLLGGVFLQATGQ